MDGSKRTAWKAAVRILFMEGLEIVATDEEAFAFVLDVANKKIGRDQVVEWLGASGRLRAAPPEALSR